MRVISKGSIVVIFGIVLGVINPVQAQTVRERLLQLQEVQQNLKQGETIYFIHSNRCGHAPPWKPNTTIIINKYDNDDSEIRESIKLQDYQPGWEEPTDKWDISILIGFSHRYCNDFSIERAQGLNIVGPNRSNREIRWEPKYK